MSLDGPFTELPPEYTAFYLAWKNARVGCALPIRTNIRLQDFAQFADSMQIYELKASGQLHCRLMGSEIVDRTSNFDADDNIFDFFEAEVRQVAERYWHTLAVTPCGGLSQFSVGYANGSNKLAKTLILPILGKTGNTLFLIYNTTPQLMSADMPRERLVLAQGGYRTEFIDIGFGLPSP